jgi:Domain of unknown function (DUF4382)
MDRQGHPCVSRAVFPLLPLTACLLSLIGCNNACLSGTLNGPNGSTVNIKAASPPPSCGINTANGILHLEVSAAPGASYASSGMGPHIIHLLVTLAEADVHSSPLAGDDTPGWQPLAQQLQGHPFQLDLLATPGPNGSSQQIPDSVLPAGIYRQIRLRFAGLPPAGLPFEESIPGANRCGRGSPHCAVMSDGRVWPLVFPASRPALRIMLENASERELYVPPDDSVTLVIELDPVRSYLWSSRDSLFFAPVFRLSVRQPASSSQD